MTRFYYLATPYSRHPGGIHNAHREACQAAAAFARAGVPVYCPIAHSHVLAMQGGIDPHDHAIWLPLAQPFIELAWAMLIVKLPGWETSVGVKAEREMFERAGKSVTRVEWPIVPEQIRDMGTILRLGR